MTPRPGAGIARMHELLIHVATGSEPFDVYTDALLSLFMSARMRRGIGVWAGVLVLVSAAALAQDRGVSLVRAPVGPDGQVTELYRGSYALLVGVDEYQYRAAWGPLESIPAELENLETALKAQGFQSIQKVLNPTGIELRRAVEDFIGRYGYDDENRLVFFFAGHGHTLDDGARGYFVPKDAPDPERNEAGFRRVALSMQQVATWAEDMTARHALFAFDSCFSGTIFRTRELLVPQRIGAATAQPVRQFLSAGGAGEPVPAQSVFTPVVVRALSGAADLDGDGFVTGTELGNFVQREVIEYRTGQTPQFGKIRDVRFDQGDIVFQPPRPIIGGVATATPQAEQAGTAPALRGAPADDKAAVEETLNEYRRAYEARDVERLVRVFPSIPNQAAVAAAFDDAREVLVGMSPPDVRILSATEATARTRLNQSFVPRVGTARAAPTRDVLFTLRKIQGQWVIANLR